MDADLADLARAAGVLTAWESAAGDPMRLSEEALLGVLDGLGVESGDAPARRRSLLRLQEEALALRPLYTADASAFVALPLGEQGPDGVLQLEDGRESIVERVRSEGLTGVHAPDVPGYHRLRIDGRETILAVAPSRAFTPAEALNGGRGWGTAVQVYSLREHPGRGLGDFGDLEAFGRAAAAAGADAIALSPTHALFMADPGRYGPYAPSSRRHLNGLYGDLSRLGPDALPPETPEADLVDWASAWPTRRAALKAGFFRLQDGGDPRLKEALAGFTATGGEALLEHARFEALSEILAPSCGPAFPGWPRALQDPASPEVASLLAEHGELVDFHVFVQWLADASLAAAQAAAREAGMRIGLIADLAVGTDPGGSHAWARPGEILAGLSIGAPPDLFQAEGQDWGVAAIAPRTLVGTGYRGFIETVRAALRTAGGVRIDHAMGLERLWLVPRGRRATEGAYVSFPREDLLRLLALESRRSGAVIIAEDLGTVPSGFREALARRGVAGMDVLWFEERDGRFLPPRDWPPEAVAMTSTHDLPTVAGWWVGRDLDWTARRDPGHDASADRRERGTAREKLWAAFSEAGVARGTAPEDPAPVNDAALGFIAQAPTPLVVAPIEDLLGAVEQINLPGDTTLHPNWRRRLPGPGAEILGGPEIQPRLERLNARKTR